MILITLCLLAGNLVQQMLRNFPPALETTTLWHRRHQMLAKGQNRACFVLNIKTAPEDIHRVLELVTLSCNELFSTRQTKRPIVHPTIDPRNLCYVRVMSLFRPERFLYRYGLFSAGSTCRQPATLKWSLISAVFQC
jgi:hypothetical protein